MGSSKHKGHIPNTPLRKFVHQRITGNYQAISVRFNLNENYDADDIMMMIKMLTAALMVDHAEDSDEQDSQNSNNINNNIIHNKHAMRLYSIAI